MRDNDFEMDDENRNKADSDTDSVISRRIAAIAGVKILKQKLLDRPAKVVSREKPNLGTMTDHTSAIVLRGANCVFSIFIAEKDGSDECNLKMTILLQIWFRASARCEK